MPKTSLPLHPAQIEPLPVVDGGFQCLLADPPWRFDVRKSSPSRAIENHYRTMTMDEIVAMPVKSVVSKDCHLFLWTTGPWLERTFAVARAWGFRYSGSGFVWIKLTKRSGDAQYELRTLNEWLMLLHTGLGFTTRKNAEFCLLFRRGNARRIAKDIHEIIIAPRREHSRKPDEAHARIERYCAGPYLELFGRQQRPGWTVWGNEADKFGTDA